MTHEHYLQTVLTTIKPQLVRGIQRVRVHAAQPLDAKRARTASRQFHFDPSPVQIYVSEERQKFYHFITTLMAIVGGVYSVMGIADGFVHNGMAMIRKANLGKQG